MAAKPRIGLGLIGSGFMGRAHAIGFATAERVFDLPFAVDFAALADIDAATAERARGALGFRRATADWRDLLSDPEIDIIDITTPNALHGPMALAALAAGKHVYCEKPLAPTATEAREMAAAAAAAGRVTQVGFNYLKNPMMTLARDMIRAGEIGAVRTFRGIFAEDFMADAALPWAWRLDPANGGGALPDLGSHILATARHLLGPVREVFADVVTAIPRRPVRAGAAELRPVEVDDVVRMLLRFESGATGSIEANWIATGQKMQHAFEIYGSEGGITFTQERFNELRITARAAAPGRGGFTTVLAAPDHEPYGAFCVAPGHQIGFNDLKAIEVRDFLSAIAGGARVGPDFAEGYAVQRLVDAAYRSAREQRWIAVD